VLDLDAPGGDASVDLPAARPAAPATSPSPFGSVDLPAARAGATGGFGGAPGLPAVLGGAGHPPATAPRDYAGLPSPVGAGAGLPGAARPPAGLPVAAPGSAGLPAVARGAGLPMPAHNDLPIVGGGALPMPATSGLPAPSVAGLPMPGGGAGLPQVGGPGLPTASGAGLPVTSAGGLPVAGGSNLPMAGGANLPSALDAFPAPAGAAGLPALAAGLPVPVGGEASLDGARPPSGGGVGGELDLEAGPALGVAGSPGIPLKKQPRKAYELDETPRSPARVLKFVALGMVGIVVVGLALALVPGAGPFGMHYIEDKVFAEQNDAALVSLRTEAQGSLDEDTLGGANAASERAKAASASAPRHQDTSAYAAFVLYARSIRFGRDGASESAAKTMLESTERTRTTGPQLLANAAEDVLAGQLARARQTVQQALSQAPDDVDAAVLAGEIELVAKEPNAAVAAFAKAVSIHKSARTLFGLARAQKAAGKIAEAEATSKSVLELSKNHVSARTLLASIAANTSAREGEALELLKAVTADETIRKNASQTELVEAYVQLGRVQLLASRMSQAQEAFGEALKLDPQAVAALVGSGELFYRAGRYSEAEARFESALRADADNVDAKIGTAKTWISLERTKEAKELLTKLQATHPSDSRVFYWLARIEETAGKRKDAEALYNEAIKKATGPETGVPAYVGLSQLLATINKPDEATKKLQEAGEKYPDSHELARARGDVAQQMGRLDEAQAQYEAALKKDPDDLGTRFQLGVTMRKMRRFPEAIAIFEEVGKIDRDFPGLALERGLYYEETGQTDQALQMYNEALARAPNDIDLKLRIGSTLVAAGQAKQAEQYLKDVIRERSGSPEANHFYGRAQLLSGSNLNEAMRHLRKAVELDANRAEYQLYVGWAANEAGQPQIAEAALAKAVELDATMGDAYWQRGILLQRRGSVKDAIEDLKKALQLKPSRIEAYATLAKCFEELNDYPKADAAWREAIKGNDKVADWHYAFGRLLERRNQDKDAVVEFEKALELAQNKEPRPSWVADAHRLLGDAYRTSDKQKALLHYSEFLRLSPADNAYRGEIERAVKELKP
jgi:tetratricopeptide (TPR) repeat protein